MKNFSKFTWKRLRWDLVFNEVIEDGLYKKHSIWSSICYLVLVRFMLKNIYKYAGIFKINLYQWYLKIIKKYSLFSPRQDTFRVTAHYHWLNQSIFYIAWHVLFVVYLISISSLLYFKIKKVRKNLWYLLKPAHFINMDTESMCKSSLRL